MVSDKPPPDDAPAVDTAAGASNAFVAGPGPAPPQHVLELAAACVRFVATSLQIEPDFTRETLPIVDHYLEDARRTAQAQPEALRLVANAAGVYFGEVVRRVYPSWWRLEGDDPLDWRLEFRDVYLAFSPVEMVHAALIRPSDPSEEPAFVMSDDDREAVEARLAEIPPVSDQDYYAPSTRLEVIDIAVDAIRSNHLRECGHQHVYRPGDYDVSVN
jgi:hypothetical protein